MNTFNAPLVAEIHEAAAAYIKTNAIPEIDFHQYREFLETGHRQIFEKEYFARRRQLAVLAIEQVLHPHAENLYLLENVMWAICNEYTWAVPAHLPTRNGQYTEDAKYCVDLFGSETAEALAETVHHLQAELSPMLVARVKLEINSRIFQPFLAKEWFWESGVNNWSAVVSGSVGMAAIYVLTKGAKLQTEILNKVATILTRYIAGFHSDGVSLEGVGYWAYGFGYYTYFAQLFQATFANDRFLNGDKIKEIAAFPARVQLGEQLFVPFSDYTGSTLPSGLVSFCHDYFAVETPLIKTVPGLDFDHCYRFAHLTRNVFWSSVAVAQPKPQLSTHFLPDAEWLLVKNDHDFFAAKGGTNNESHNHNDVGSFVVGADGVCLLTDLGAGEYTKDYFQEEKRYSFLNTSSLGHSVPIINGTEQRAGAVGAKRVKFAEQTLTMNLEACYPVTAQLKNYQRQFSVAGFPQKIVLDDTFEFLGDRRHVVENFVSDLAPQLIAEGVAITHQETTLVISCPQAVVVVEKRQYASHDAQVKTAYLIRFEVAGTTAHLELELKRNKES